MIRSRSSTRAVATADAIIEYAKTKRKTSLCESQERFPLPLYSRGSTQTKKVGRVIENESQMGTLVRSLSSPT